MTLDRETTRPYFSMENADWEALEPLAAETGRQAA